MKRRDLIKNLSVLPASKVLLGSTLPIGAMMASCASETPKRDLLNELGLRKIINAVGTVTFMTGSLMHDEVLEAINTSAQDFVILDEVQDKVGEKIAELCHAEAAMVSAGCWSAMILGTAGVLTGMDAKKAAQLPNLDGMKSEVIVQKSHNQGYIHALKNTGVKIVEVETAEDFPSVVNEKTAMMWFLNYCTPNGKILHEEWVAIGKKYNIPNMIDIAADVPPVENLWRFNDMGFDLVCISGGKAMRGPQSAGILMGKKDLIAAARLNSPPRGGNIGRGMKVNKEEILGMYVALEKYVNTDHDKEWKMWEDRIAVIDESVKRVNGITTEIKVPVVANHTPNLHITWDVDKVKLTTKDLQEKMRFGDPSIEIMGGSGNNVALSVFMLKPGQEKIIAERLYEE
jgi:L-seryl-tRNA(Ser) seleniumtransferase